MVWQAHLDPPESPDKLDKTDHPVVKEKQVCKVLPVPLASPDHRDPQANQVIQDHREKEETRAVTDTTGEREIQERGEIPDHRESLDFPD